MKNREWIFWAALIGWGLFIELKLYGLIDVSWWFILLLPIICFVVIFIILLIVMAIIESPDEP